MRILFLIQCFPFPPCDGISVKVYTLIRHLASKGWGCDILCFGNHDAGLRVAEFEKIAAGVKVRAVIPLPSTLERAFGTLSSLLKGLPPSFGGFKSRRFRAALEKISAETGYDAAHYDVINMAQYLPFGPKVPSVLSSNDAISLFYSGMIKECSGIFRKAYLRLSAWLIRRFEAAYYKRFDKVHVVSEADAAHLKNICPEINLEVIPLVVDKAFIDYKPQREHGQGKDAVRIVFTGNLAIPGIANGLFEFLDNAYAELLSGASPFEFHILGPNASPEDEKRVLAFPGVKYLRWAKDYKAFLMTADIVLVLDKSGTGIKNRVLEAMAFGKPVVGTKIAFGGIAAENGRHCFISNSPQETGAELKSLLTDTALREKIGASARELILSSYSMAALGPQWERLYKDIIPQKS